VFVTLFFFEGGYCRGGPAVFYSCIKLFQNLCTGVCDSLVHMKIGLWTMVRFDAHLMDSKAATHVLR
jgi:hypothetical protein